MAEGRKAEIGSELRKEADKSATRLMALGALLVFIHLLNIAPSEFETLGAKFSLKDPIILRSVVAALYLNELHLIVLQMRMLRAYGAMYTLWRQVARSSLRRRRKQGRSVKVVKRLVRLEEAAWVLPSLPYFAALFGIFVVGALLSVKDMFDLVQYCYYHTEAGRQLKEFLYL